MQTLNRLYSRQNLLLSGVPVTNMVVVVVVIVVVVVVVVVVVSSSSSSSMFISSTIIQTLQNQYMIYDNKQLCWRSPEKPVAHRAGDINFNPRMDK